MAVEPQVEPTVELEESDWYILSKFGGDYYIPPVVEDNISPDRGPVSPPWWYPFSDISPLSRDQFFREVRSHFSRIPWTDRRSRARAEARGRLPSVPMPAGVPEIPFNQPVSDSRYLEIIEQQLISKFRPEAVLETTYRQKREAERREGEVKSLTVNVMGKEEFLRDLQDKIGSIPFKEKKADHKSAVSRPGIRKQFQEELHDLSDD